MSNNQRNENNVDKIVVENQKENETISKTSFFHTDKEMLRFKLHFFLFEGGTASVAPFIPVVAKNNLGLSATSLAVVVALQQLITIVTKPIIGYIADYFNRLKLIINILLIIQTISFFLILAIPSIKKPPTSIQPFPLSDQFKNWKELSELIVIRVCISHCNNSSTEIPASDTVNNNEKESVVENSPFIDVECIQHINGTKLLCFGNETNDKTTVLKFEDEQYCSCSAIYTNKLPEVTQLYNKTVHFTLILLDSPLPEYRGNETTLPCTILPNGHAPNSTAKPDVSDFETLGFWMFAVVSVVTNICLSSLFSLSDTACCESVQKLGGEFGRQRLFGAVGWGILAAVSGMLCDVTGGYITSWIFMAVLQMIALWNISQLDLMKPHFSQSLLRDIGRVLKSIEFSAFELGVFFNGIGTGVVWFYLIWFLSGLGASKFLCGLTQYIECFLGEIPFLFFAGWFIEKLGHFNLLSISLLSYALRFLWYSYLQNPWFVLPAEIAHGFTYGTLFPAIASYAKLSAKPGTEASTLSILFVIHDGLGAGLGCILTGLCFDIIGPHQTFFYYSLIFSCATVLNIIISSYFKRRNIKKVHISPISSGG